jgi:hypothetical protein
LRKTYNANVAEYKRNPTKTAMKKLKLSYHPNKHQGLNAPKYDELFKELGNMFEKNPPRNSVPVAAAKTRNNSKRPLAIMPPRSNNSKIQLVPRPPSTPRPRVVPAPVPARNSNVVKGFKALPLSNAMSNKKAQNNRIKRASRIAIINRARRALGNPAVVRKA